jgi:hypothetical protein
MLVSNAPPRDVKRHDAVAIATRTGVSYCVVLRGRFTSPPGIIAACLKPPPIAAAMCELRDLASSRSTV